VDVNSGQRNRPNCSLMFGDYKQYIGTSAATNGRSLMPAAAATVGVQSA